MDVYHAEFAQKNGQWAFVSPIYAGCKAEARRRRKTEKTAAWDGARCTRHGKNKKEGKHNVYRDCKKGRNGASV